MWSKHERRGSAHATSRFFTISRCLIIPFVRTLHYYVLLKIASFRCKGFEFVGKGKFFAPRVCSSDRCRRRAAAPPLSLLHFPFFVWGRVLDGFGFANILPPSPTKGFCDKKNIELLRTFLLPFTNTKIVTYRLIYDITSITMSKPTLCCNFVYPAMVTVLSGYGW